MKSAALFAGLLVAMTGVTAATAAAAPAARPITITVDNARFTPARITMRRGASYVLRIRNRSDRRHNFSTPEFFKLARVAPRDSVLVSDNKVDLKAGQSATLHIVAPDTPNAVYGFRSTNLRDAASGLKGEIVVQ